MSASEQELLLDCYIVETRECAPEHVLQVGGKAVGLGRLLRAGERVPASFVVTASAYRAYAEDLYAAFVSRSLPLSVQRAVEDAYRGLCEHLGVKHLPVAVRSSASIEDGLASSCAGQFKTFLGARTAAQVCEGVAACFACAMEPNVEVYRSRLVSTAELPAVAVIVQELIDPKVAGVLFTSHPRTGDPSILVVESSYGLGEAVVGGEVAPDLFEVNKVTGQLQTRTLGSKALELHWASEPTTVSRQSVDIDRREVYSLTDTELAAVVELASRLERRIGKGLDVEWAIGTSAGPRCGEELFALQVRPITVDPRRAKYQPSVDASDPIGAVLSRLGSRKA